MFRRQGNLITISRGPQFGRKAGVFNAFVFVGALILSIVSLAGAYYVLVLPLLILSVSMFSLMIDIRGVDIDLNKNRLMPYKKFLWIKQGKWEDLSAYGEVQLRKNLLLEHPTLFSGNQTDVLYRYYHIVLADSEKMKEVVVAEFRGYVRAYKFCWKLSHELHMVFRNKAGQKPRPLLYRNRKNLR